MTLYDKAPCQGTLALHRPATAVPSQLVEVALEVWEPAAGREARDRRKALCIGCSYKHTKPTYTFCHYGNKGQCPNAQPSSEELDFAAPPNG